MRRRLQTRACLLGLFFLGPALDSAAQYAPADGPLMTTWAEDISPEQAHPEYPRPQLVRDTWLNLNGLWDYAIRPWREERPTTWDGQILVPFAIESALSGVMRTVGPDNRLWYRREFTIPAASAWQQKRILLHFGGVDWESEIWIDGQRLGEHRGGYDPFTIDITQALRSHADRATHEVVVAVWDPTDAGFQPRGKQVRDPRGIWYTSVTGIWQTVWLEAVPESYIRRVRIVPDVDQDQLHVTTEVAGTSAGTTVRARLLAVHNDLGNERILLEDDGAGGSAGEAISLDVPQPKRWSPSAPWLYDVSITLHADNGRLLDEVRSYTGLRKISLGKAEDGFTRLFLNNEPLFQYGPLDQGWWPDGLYTAPSDEALRYDIEVTRQLGFNMIRKHVKVEPARWYYWCDKLGLLVWQDMPSGDRYIRPADEDIQRVAQSSRQFEIELRRVVDAFGNHPSIVVWVPFNEGWGQYDTGRITRWIEAYDPTRLVISASGWTDRGTGAAHDIHSYPGPDAPQPEENRAAVLGEFGGLGLPLAGHTWQDEENWGYRSYETPEALTEAYERLLERLRPLIGWKGLAAAVYTQTTDVEIEVNGLLTYDRAVIKMPADRVAAANRKLYTPPPRLVVVVPTAQQESALWRYTTHEPAEGWRNADFDDSTWQLAAGGFGTRETPGAVVRTDWDTDEIWLRRHVTLPPETRFERPHLLIHHDEDAEVSVNGVVLAQIEGYVSSYVLEPLNPQAADQLRRAVTGGNREIVLAVHCRQTGGGQFIDVGLVDVRDPHAD